MNTGLFQRVETNMTQDQGPCFSVTAGCGIIQSFANDFTILTKKNDDMLMMRSPVVTAEKQLQQKTTALHY